MGTSHRHKPAGSPKWGNASKAVTQISKDVSESDELSNNPSPNSSPQKIAKRQSTLEKRISRSYHHAVRDMVRASGGRSSVAKGASRVMGHSGVYYAGIFTSAFQEIAEQGLSPESWRLRFLVLRSGNPACRGYRSRLPGERACHESEAPCA